MSNAKSVILIQYDTRLIAKVLQQKLGLGLTADSILNPDAEVAQSIFSNFIRYILNVSEQSLLTLPLSADSGHDPELHKKTIPLVIIYQCMKAFIVDNSDRKLELTMCDLVTPEKQPNRFRRLTSFLVDFIKLHEMSAPIFNEISDEFSEQKQEMERMQDEIIQAEKRKNDLISKQSLRKRRENELMNEHSKIKSELAGVVSQYTDVLERTEEIEKQEKELIQQIEEIEREIMTAKKTVEHLTEEVLASPEELKQEMANRKKQIEELKESLVASRQTLKSKLEARNICANAEKNVPLINQRIQAWSEVREDILDMMDEVEEKLRKLNEIQEQLAFAADKKTSSEKRMIEQTEMHEQLRREHLQRSEKLSKNIDEIARQIAALGTSQPDVSRDIENKRQELLAAKNAHSEKMALINNAQKDALAKHRKIDDHFKETLRVAVEKRNAMERIKNRVSNAYTGRLPSDYTFSASSINESENCDPQSPVFENFSVFNN
ncbi:unnamed protein product [Caenorhabditis nigoni]